MTDGIAVPAGPVAGLKRNRNRRLLWTGQAVAITGNFVFNATVVPWIATIIAKNKSWGRRARLPGRRALAEEGTEQAD
jgi:hypothetical protein